MIVIVQYLIFGSGDIDRFEYIVTILVLGSHFLSQIEDTGVTALGNLPFHFQFEVLEFVSEDQISAVTVLRFTAAGTVELDTAVLDSPLGRHSVLTVTTPSVECFSVKDGDVTIRIYRQLQAVRLCRF